MHNFARHLREATLPFALHQQLTLVTRDDGGEIRETIG